MLGTKADVGKEEDVKAAVDKAVSEFGRLDIMVRSLPLVTKADFGFLLTSRPNSSTMRVLCILQMTTP